ncbi:MAG: hypothetical protein CL676_04810 [Bdellovibrionaceae bacterium]|nr:hypothetical protein [Pseudobdellovibrionaceae bacterium]|tara:strand:+ start:5022 stop:5864 length:843 start_codon:yes stop_codon:yes gene_type:complete
MKTHDSILSTERGNMKIHFELLELRQKERRITSEILNKLQEMEDSRQYLEMGHPSLFDYLVRGLGYSEATAYQRQACVRLAKEVPEIKQKIDQGTLSLTAVTKAFKHLRTKPLEEKRKVLKSLENKSSKEVKCMFFEPMKPLKVQKTEYVDKVLLRLELTHEQNQKLEKLKALKSHKYNIESLLVHLIEKELKSYESIRIKPSKANEIAAFKKSKSKNPRQISKFLRNDVLEAAGYKCQHPGCDSNHFLQIDHIVPVRRGGDQRRSNLQVLCANHNQRKG